ncbi:MULTISPECIES: MFS transporter [unclassified Beijerinckia]|uniref:MFS transporter n=1 Tax=unclassified Beijerinckia TaxID=2638183 RepID=UPI000899F829|nr:MULTISPECIES: MFS transporter [unclassified Beijerinckia]MDH7797056.1 D-galactonate transporter [Beijerinckia sp. GAS462]SEC70473.1 D-galactonate transporter [Beijerinckia sp. 28-YEA-48]
MDTSQPHPSVAFGELPDKIEQTYYKVTIRLMPFLILCYFVAQIDRANISFAKLQFMSDLGFSEVAYGFGAGLFFIGYSLFEVPSNIMMQRVGVRRTLLRIMVLWGLVSIGMMFVTSPIQFYVMRFLLGVAEAGFFPGVLLYLTYWFPAARRGRATGFLMMGAAVAGIIIGPISAWIMSHLAGLHGLHGWQWLFLLEGLPAVILGIIAFFFLSDQPRDAKWLTEHEKAIILSDLAAEEKGISPGRRHALLDALKNVKVYIGILVYFCIILSFNAVSLWIPTVIHDLGVKDLFNVGLLSSVVFLAGAAGTYLIGSSSDRRMERRWHLTVSCAFTALSFALLPLAARSIPVAIALLSIASAAIYGAFSVFWTIPATFLPGNTKAGGIALITSLGGLAAFVSPTLIGWMTAKTGSVYLGLTISGGLTLVGALVLLIAIPVNASCNEAAR